MSRYGRITADIRLIPDSNTTVDGIHANRDEWAKKGYKYPKVGMVGEILHANGIQVLKICDGFYVPFTGVIEAVTEEEYINDRYDPVTGEYGNVADNIHREAEYIHQKYGPEGKMNPSLIESQINFIYRDAYIKAKGVMGEEIIDRIKRISYELGALPICDFTYEDAISKFAKLIAAEMAEEGDDPKDKNMIAWFSGLHADSYVMAMAPYKKLEFKTVFKDIFKTYMLSL